MTPPSEVELRVLGNLARDWAMDRAGWGGMAAVMVSGRGRRLRVSAEVVADLYSRGLIRPSETEVADWQITRAGRTLAESTRGDPV